MFAVWAFTLLCFMPVSHSAVDCNDLLKSPDKLEFRRMEGTWAMVADSIQIIESQQRVPPIVSLSITFSNSTYTRAVSVAGRCFYDSHNVSHDGPNFKIHVPFNYTGTILRTSCADCVVLNLSLDSPREKVNEVCLFSKRRKVEPKEMKEFIAQLECLNMPDPHVMDPDERLCPAHSF